MESALGVKLVAVGVFGFVTCAVLLVTTAWRRREERVARRFSEALGGSSKADSGQGARKPGLSIADFLGSAAATSISTRLLPSNERSRSLLQERLYQAGIYRPGAMSVYFSVKLLLLVGPPIIGWLIGFLGFVSLWRGTMFGCLAGGMGMILPTFWIDYRCRARQALIRAELPDYLDLLAICAEAGAAIHAGLKRVTEELSTTHPTVAEEFRIVLREAELGESIESALLHVAERTTLSELRMLHTFALQSLRYGTTLADAMRDLVDALRFRREQRLEEEAQKASVKILMPTLLFIFPAVFVV
jgi:tight adherence protein C